MWDLVPDVVVELLAELAPPAALPTLALLERRCRPPTSARLAILARLRAPPFSMDGPAIVGASCPRPLTLDLRVWVGGRVLPSQMEILTTALASGALPMLQVLLLNNNQIGNEGMMAFSGALRNGALPQLQVRRHRPFTVHSQSIHATFSRMAGARPRQYQDQR